MSITYSFDIFDTIITRRTANPHGIFSIIQKKLKQLNEDIPEEIKENFFELRIESERLARSIFCKNGCEEVTISQIYYAFGTTGLLNENVKNKLIEIEFETELENIIPIPQMISEILNHLEKKETVIFISDMYLDNKMIYQMLETVDKRLVEVPLYLSSDIRKTKATGNLFRFIHDDRQLTYSDWIHIGDNYESDNLIPKNLGINVVLLQNRRLISIESTMLKNSKNSVSAQLLVGISKNTRILLDLNKEKAIGTSLSGLLLGSYVKWILNDAVQRGIKKLYFIARDGYILKKIADIFIDNMELNLSAKYLYGSRKAWRMPAQVTEKIDIIKLLHASTPAFLQNLAAIADVFEISSSELQNFLPKKKKSVYCKLARIDIDIVFYYLSEQEDFKRYLMSKHQSKRELVLEYLQQEIDLSEDQIAFVEVGGSGYTQKCLEKLLKNIYTGKISTYFFQLYEISEDVSHFLNYIPDELYMKDSIEPLCRAPHGQTLGYVKKDGKILPLFEEFKNKEYFECYYNKYIEGVLAYTKIYMQYYKNVFQEPVDRKILSKCWCYYTHTKDKGILDFIGEVPFEAFGHETQNSKYAPKLSKEDIKKYIKEPFAWNYNGASIEMSILRMGKEDRKLFKKYKKWENENKNIQLDLKENTANVFAKIPAERYCPGTKIVIYGAGTMGKAFYFHSVQEQNYNIVLWVDKQYYNYENSEYPVVSPDKLLKTYFDVLVIAVLDKTLKDSIKNDLLDWGISQEKIDWISPKELLCN